MRLALLGQLELAAIDLAEAGLAALDGDLADDGSEDRRLALYIVDRWRLDYNHHRPHSSLGNVPPAEFARRRIPAASATLQPSEYARAI